MTQAIVGKIYKIKKGGEKNCGTYGWEGGAAKIKIDSINKTGKLIYDILDSQNNIICWCGCFTESDLEEIEKTLNNLEIGDVVIYQGFKQTILSVHPSAPDNRIYDISPIDDQKQVLRTISAHSLETEGYTILSSPPTPKKTVDDVLAQLSEEDKEIVKNALK